MKIPKPLKSLLFWKKVYVKKKSCYEQKYFNFLGSKSVKNCVAHTKMLWLQLFAVTINEVGIYDMKKRQNCSQKALNNCA